jgi:hypothetical protein
MKLKKTINSFKNKNCNINEISTKLYKDISDIICDPLATIMNECIQQGIFPDVLKIARVTPLHKGGDITPNNYRPISNLNKISKIFEKIVHNRLMNFFLKYKILSNKQFSYIGKIIQQLMYWQLF